MKPLIWVGLIWVCSNILMFYVFINFDLKSIHFEN